MLDVLNVIGKTKKSSDNGVCSYIFTYLFRRSHYSATVTYRSVTIERLGVGTADACNAVRVRFKVMVRVLLSVALSQNCEGAIYFTFKLKFSRMKIQA